MSKYLKKPLEIDAFKVRDINIPDLKKLPDLVKRGIADGCLSFTENGVFVQTLEGTMLARNSDYLICGIEGEWYPCKPSVFNATYTRQDSDNDR